MPSKTINDGGRNGGYYKFGGGANQVLIADGSLASVNTVTYDSITYYVGYIIDGGGGNDNLQGAGGDDCLIGGKGDDYLNSLAGNDVLDGGSGNDVLSDGYGNDILFGGDGNDTMFANRGNDTLVGGAGSDTFKFDDTPSNLGTDTFQDFVSGTDTIAFITGFFNGRSFGYLSDNPTGANVIYDTANGYLYLDSDGYNSGVNPVLVAQLGANTTLLSSDLTYS